MKVKVRVLANSSKKELIKLDGENYKVYLTCIAEDGKANKDLITFLKKEFKSKGVKILKGFRTKNKLIEIEE
jgi:uncharacterized protein (TIGR00251 family)